MQMVQKINTNNVKGGKSQMEKIRTAGITVLSAAFLLSGISSASAMVRADGTPIKPNSPDEMVIMATPVETTTPINVPEGEIINEPHLIHYTDGEMQNQIKVNGITLETKVHVYGKDGQLMVPLRLISEALGYTVTWNSDTKTVGLSKEQKVAQINLGEDSYFYGKGKLASQSLGVASELKTSLTFVPITFFSKILNVPSSVEGTKFVQFENELTDQEPPDNVWKNDKA
jgi:CBS domain-containing protein